MKVLLILGGLLVQENVAPTPELDPALLSAEAGEAAPAPPAPEPWAGTFAWGMNEVTRLAASEDWAGALELSDRLLAPDGYARWRTELEEEGGFGAALVQFFDGPLTWIGLETLPAADRAEVRFARGLLSARQQAVVDADTEFELVRVLAGPGELRQAAIYALGLLDLRMGEELRQKIPEISGAQPAPPPGPPGPAGAQAEEVDPLEVAREAYLAARAHLVERLRLDWHDANSRANVELCVRRLRELEEIERQREEQDQEQPQQEPQEGEPDPNAEPQEQEDGQESEQETEQEPEPEDGPPEDPAESEQEESQEPQPAEPAERLLTDEEMKQLLDILRKHQEQGDEIEEKLRGQRRAQTDRDW